MQISVQEKDWLSQVLQDFGTGNATVTLEDIQIKADELRSHLAAAQSNISTAMQKVQGLVAAQRKPSSLTDKFDKIFLVTTSVFALLQHEGVSVPEDALTAYVNAKNVYNDLKPQCLANANDCLKFGPVLAHLETMRDSIRTSLEQSGRNDLEEKINLLFQ